eukprot:TRINITY_DN12735_c0_g1_i1.p1 TRINITY_DN12735_c0_g1~~TRINITY_DN12735_c0_g1_i1.p1  ORF type:complete len:310 (-),score=84.21 TRINITY_DN12735_c0_g1_i1:301-1230(-)
MELIGRGITSFVNELKRYKVLYYEACEEIHRLQEALHNLNLNPNPKSAAPPAADAAVPPVISVAAASPAASEVGQTPTVATPKSKTKRRPKRKPKSADIAAVVVAPEVSVGAAAPEAVQTPVVANSKSQTKRKPEPTATAIATAPEAGQSFNPNASRRSSAMISSVQRGVVGEPGRSSNEEMKPVVVLDTNVLLTRLKDVKKNEMDRVRLLIPFTVIQEVDGLKNSVKFKTRRRAREASHFLNECARQKLLLFERKEDVDAQEEQADDRIIACAQRNRAALATLDINMQTKAIICNVPVINDFSTFSKH